MVPDSSPCEGCCHDLPETGNPCRRWNNLTNHNTQLRLDGTSRDLFVGYAQVLHGCSEIGFFELLRSDTDVLLYGR